MTVQTLICVDETDDPIFDSPALIDFPELPAPGDFIHLARELPGDRLGTAILRVRTRRFSLEKSWVQLDCDIVDNGRSEPRLRSI